MYSPLSHWGCLAGGKRVGIVGIGGLGQMGVRLAKAMGNTVTAISTSPHKETVAREIGADNFVLSNKPESMAAAAKSLDLILNTVSADHDLTALIGDSQMMLVMVMVVTMVVMIYDLVKATLQSSILEILSDNFCQTEQTQKHSKCVAVQNFLSTRLAGSRWYNCPAGSCEETSSNLPDDLLQVEYAYSDDAKCL